MFFVFEKFYLIFGVQTERRRRRRRS